MRPSNDADLRPSGTAGMCLPLCGRLWPAALTLALAAALPAVAQDKPALKSTYVSLGGDANAVLWELPDSSPNGRIVVVNTHADHNNNLEYFVGLELAARGYRALNMNYYGPEATVEEFLPHIADAVRYARSLPGVEKVVFATHSGGGPILAFYQEIAENGPAACQEPDRLLPCDGKDLTDLPPVDGLLLLDVNVGAIHRTMSIDPAVKTGAPDIRDPALDLYSSANGFDPASNSATYPEEFRKRFLAAQHDRSEALIDEARAQWTAVETGTGAYQDDAPFVVDGMAANTQGARLNLADASILSRTHGVHLHLKADGSTPVEIVPLTRPAGATPEELRDTLAETTQETSVRHYLSFLAISTTPEYALTEDDIPGVDWRSSGNSPAGSVQNVSVPTLVMVGTCAVHMVPNEIVFDKSAAADKEFVAVEGANHSFRPCRKEFGDTRIRAFDYVDAWLSKPGRL